jgi:hypothetical protein
MSQPAQRIWRARHGSNNCMSPLYGRRPVVALCVASLIVPRADEVAGSIVSGMSIAVASLKPQPLNPTRHAPSFPKTVTCRVEHLSLAVDSKQGKSVDAGPSNVHHVTRTDEQKGPSSPPTAPELALRGVNATSLFERNSKRQLRNVCCPLSSASSNWDRRDSPGFPS